MEKEPLILLPGTLCDERLWNQQINGLVNIADASVISLHNHDSIEGLALEVLSKAPQKFSMAGLSLGGIVALEIMRLAPDRVNRLALLSTNPFLPRPEQQEVWNKFIALSKSGNFLDITKDYLLPVLIDDANRTGELEHIIIEMAEQIGAAGYVNQLRAVASRKEQSSILSTIKCPTIVIGGEEDKVCPVSLIEYMGNAIPNAKQQIVSNAGHLITMEQPEKVTDALKEWLVAY